MSQNNPTQVHTTTPLSRRPGPWKIDDVIELRALKTRIDTTLADNIADPSAARKIILDQLEHAQFRGRMIAQERLQQGADGLETTRLLSAVQDVVIQSLFYYLEAINTHTDGARPNDISILATGGYGRGLLAPNSDVDLLFLTTPNAPPETQAHIEALLYCLWDLKLKIGHATRTIKECIQLASEDITIKTALLDARHICGDEGLFTQFETTYEAKIKGQGREDFINQKLAERDAYHSKTGHSPYVVEPHIKEGMGGLRDLQTLFWITKFYRGGVFFEDVMSKGDFSKAEMRNFMDAARFLLTVRCHLHFLTGRAEDRLNFDVQPEIARRMQYRDKAGQLGVERFMKRYFLIAREIGILLRFVAARMGEDMETPIGGILRQIGDVVPNYITKASLPDGFEYRANKIYVGDGETFKDAPENLIRAFLWARDTELALHPETFGKIRRIARKMPLEVADQPAVQAALLDAITGPKVERVLGRLTEAGVLGRLIPEFGQIVAQTQFNMYHHFTIDEHTLRAVGGLEDMETGDWPVANAQSVFKAIKNRRVLYLAMLLHDTGKGLGDQQILGEQTSMAACRRLGLADAETTLVGWLVRNHLEMSEVAQKRDISDPRTILDFAKRVKTIERLNLLYLLTCADINAVGPGVFSTWKGQLLAELHTATALALRGGRTEEAAIGQDLRNQAVGKKAALIAEIGGLPTRLANLEPAYWLGFDHESQLSHARWVAKTSVEDVATHLSYSEHHQLSELIVIGQDVPGLFAKVVDAIGAKGGNIVSAHAYSDTVDVKNFVDIFYIDFEVGHITEGDNTRWNNEILAGIKTPDKSTKIATNLYDPAQQKRSVFIVTPEINLRHDISATSLVLEIAAANERGVLAAICDVIAAHDLSIFSAHISSFGERVFDVFYIQDQDGQKPSDIDALAALEDTLTQALKAFGQDAPSTAIRALERSVSAKSY